VKPDADPAQDLLQQAQVQQLQQQLQLQELMRTRSALQRLLGSTERRSMLADMFSSWKRVSEQVAHLRREAFFDSMRGHLQTAKNKYQAAQQSHTRFLKLVEVTAGRALAKAGMRAWRSLVKLRAQKLKSAGSIAELSCSSRARASLVKILVSWRCHSYCCILQRSMHHTEPASDVDAETPTLDSLLQDMSLPKRSFSLSQEGESRTQESLTRSHLTRSSSAGPRPESGRQSPLRRPPSPRKQVAQRQPLTEQDDNMPNDSEAAGAYKRIRGPERFYYDTSSYTGCARFGGPSVGKENDMELRSRKTKGACAEKPPTSQQPLQVKRMNSTTSMPR